MPANIKPSFAVNDPDATVQMTRGFYAVEGGAWRWAAPQFSVVLAAPIGAAATQLELKFTIPDVVIGQTGPVTLSASARGQALPSQTYSKAGDYTYTAAIAPALLSTGAVTIDFTADKHITPGGDDTRDLSLIVTSVGLTGVDPGAK